MAASVNVPPPISFEGNVHQNWIRFFYDFEIYIGACGREKEDFVVAAMKDEEKKSYFNGLGKLLLNVAGDEARTIAATFGLEDAKKFDYRELILKFGEYAKTEVNDTYERFVFNSCVQQEGESLDHFVTELKKKAKYCGFDKRENEFIRDRIVVGIRNKKMQETLLRIKGLTMEIAIQECRTVEKSMQYSKELNGTANTIAVDSLKVSRKYDSKKKKDSRLSIGTIWCAAAVFLEVSKV